MPASLSTLSRASAGAPSAIPIARPSSRLLTRVLLPAAIILGMLGALAYAARESLRPAIPVRVAPAVLAATRAASPGSPAAPVPTEIVQAPGWLEADPYSTGVPALNAGVLKEVLVLEGEHVSKDQIVARLVDDDARLARKRALAEVARAAASVSEARSAVAVEEARTAEAAELLSRVEPLAGSGAFPESEITQRRLKLLSQRAAVEAARSAVAKAESDESAAKVAVEEADLALSRTEVRAPSAGVVLLRLVEPGQRVMPDANNPFAGVVVRLYDPAHLQIRVDIPFSDAAKVHIGDTVEVSTETLPDRTFKATITRFVHEANLQKNTVQIKAALADPAPELKPEMLAKARITTHPSSSKSSSYSSSSSASPPLLAPRSALLNIANSEASAWLLDQPTSTIHTRRLKLGRLTDTTAEILEGLHPGDRLVLSPSPDLRENAKVSPTESPEDR
jgi:RND family efflux transporter MFP subunit